MALSEHEERGDVKRKAEIPTLGRFAVKSGEHGVRVVSPGIGLTWRTYPANKLKQMRCFREPIL